MTTRNAQTSNESSFAVGYVRVSTLTQVREGHGLDVQRDKVRGWAAYAGLELRAVEEDAGVSGASTDNRPGLRRALRAVLEHGQGATLVVYKLDRLGRNAIDVQETLAVLLDAGVRVVALADGVDSASGMGAALLKLLTGILSTFAELEKENIATRLLDGRKRADEENRAYASEPRYGRQDAGDGTLTTDEHEAAAVARIRELHSQAVSVRRIAAQLAQEGYVPRRAASWSTSVVHAIATGKRAPKAKATTKRLARVRAELLSDVA